MRACVDNPRRGGVASTSATRHTMLRRRRGACSALALLLLSACHAFGDQQKDHTPDKDAYAASSRTRYPIVLVHGMAGFSDFGALEYFDGVQEALENAGYVAVAPALPPYQASRERAQHLATAVDAVLDRTGAEKVHLIGHSQGGLDSRRVVSVLGYAEKVASITTLSTPHRGSPVASKVRKLPEPLVDGTLEAVGSVYGESPEGVRLENDGSAQIDDLSIEVREAENAKTPDDPRVPIFSFAGITGARRSARCDEGAWKMYREPGPPGTLMAPTHYAMSEGEHKRANDGLVPVDSSIWGTFLGCLPADHLDLVGLSGDRLRRPDVIPFNHLVFFVDYANRIAIFEKTGSVEQMIAAGPPRTRAPITP